MSSNRFIKKRLSQVLITFLGLQVLSPLAFASNGQLTPTLGTPYMSPKSPYTVETDASFSYKIENFSGNLNVTAYIKDENSNTFKTWNIGSQGNGTHTVDWDGTFDTGKPEYGQTYYFQVKGLYGTFPNTTAYGPSEVPFTVATPALSVPTVDTNPYNPTTDSDGLGITTTVSGIYSDEYAHIYMDIFKDNTLVKTLYKKAIPSQTNTSHKLIWDGMVNGDKAPDGSYKVLVYGTYGNEDESFNTDSFVTEEKSFTVENSTVTVNPEFTEPTISENPFDISIANNTVEFTYTLENAPQGDIDVLAGVYLDDGSKNNPVYSWDLPNQGTSQKTITWDGKDANGQFVESGNYRFQINGSQGNFLLDPKQVKFTVTDGSIPVQEPTITGLTAKPSTFSPDGDGVNDATEVSFTLESDNAAEVTMTLGANAPYSANTELYNATKNAGKVTYTWNGKVPGSNTVLPDGTYPIKVKVDNADGTDEATVSVVINTQGASQDCGFTDVSASNTQLCEAFKFAKDRKIFVGDAGTTKVRPNSVINRAEAAAVIERTFDTIQHYPSDNTNLGFVDVDLNAWYMTDGTMRTAVKNGILKGDATGNTVRPGDQVINAEFVTMFVRAIQNHDAQYSTLPAVNQAPYLDTPLLPDTMWYVQTANALKKWFGLYNNKQYFYPTEGKTRADVALLIYDAYQAGLNI